VTTDILRGFKSNTAMSAFLWVDVRLLMTTANPSVSMMRGVEVALFLLILMFMLESSFTVGKLACDLSYGI
jgi:hypothetical protein